MVWQTPADLVDGERREATVLDRILRRRGVARSAVAGLTLGLSALALLAVETNARTSEATTRVRAIEAVSEQWDQLFLHVGVEYEALSDYLRADSAVGRLPLSSALGSATPSLVWLQRHGDAADAQRARAVGHSYDAYTESLRQLIAARDGGDPAAADLDAEQASLSASALRKQAVANASRKRTELNLYLAEVERRSATFRTAAIGLGAADCVLLVLCGLVLLGYQRRAESEARHSTHRALHDGLTGIPNRTLLVDRLECAVRLAKRQAGQVGLLLLDLDRFKEVNDTLGHQQGDALLCEVAERLAGAVRSSDTVARLGGDEFAVLLQGDVSEHAALDVAQRLLDVVRRPVTLEAATADVGCSIGAALYPQHGSDETELLKNADIAMYIAKRGHFGVSVYSADTDRHSWQQLAIFSELRHAIDSHELILLYQPKIRTSTGEVSGVEALVRWLHPTRGLLTPDEFIPAAERSELMIPLTDYVISAALDQAQGWVASGLHLPVSVNVGAVALLDESFPDRVAALLAGSGVPADLVTLELTETAFISDENCALIVLNRLRQLGIRLALDDFGTGYSAMAYLQKMPIQELKIDRRFITDLLTSRQNRAITRAVVEIAHALDMQVVGEGVEDAATLDALHDLECDQAQGFHLCRPITAPELLSWIAERPDAAATDPCTRVSRACTTAGELTSSTHE
jgi:diguanylate cyclase (GGDEF)-like protein